VAYADEVTADSPSGWWKLDEASGTTAVDSSGGGNPGTYTGVTIGVADIPPGMTGTCVQFTANSQVITTTLNPAWTGLTAEAWVCYNSVAPINWPFVIDTNIDGVANGWVLMSDPAGNNGVWFNAAPGNVSASAISNTQVSSTGWHHLAGTYDGSYLRVYLDGSQIAISGAVSGTIAASNAGGTQAVVMGNAQTSPYTAGRQFLGRMCQVAVYPVALSATRIGVHYTVGSTAPAVAAPPEAVTARYAPGWHPGTRLPGLPAGVPFYVPPLAWLAAPATPPVPTVIEAVVQPPAPAPPPLPRIISAAAVFAGTAALSGAGTLAATPAFTATAALSGTGTLTAAPAFAGTATLSGSGTLTAAPVFAGIATLSGSGTLGAITGVGNVPGIIQAVVQPPAAPRAPPPQVILAPVGAVQAGAATLSGQGTLTAAPYFAGAPALSGSGTLTATPVLAGTVALSGTGTLSGAPALTVTVTLSGAGALTAAPMFTGAASLSGTGTLTATPYGAAAAALSGAGTLGTAWALLASAVLSGTGMLTATPVVVVPVAQPLFTTGVPALGWKTQAAPAAAGWQSGAPGSQWKEG
jgi:hypothetical protein